MRRYIHGELFFDNTLHMYNDAQVSGKLTEQ